jgi:hypothetical protein
MYTYSDEWKEKPLSSKFYGDEVFDEHFSLPI